MYMHEREGSGGGKKKGGGGGGGEGEIRDVGHKNNSH